MVKSPLVLKVGTDIRINSTESSEQSVFNVAPSNERTNERVAIALKRVLCYMDTPTDSAAFSELRERKLGRTRDLYPLAGRSPEMMFSLIHGSNCIQGRNIQRTRSDIFPKLRLAMPPFTITYQYYDSVALTNSTEMIPTSWLPLTTSHSSLIIGALESPHSPRAT